MVAFIDDRQLGGFLRFLVKYLRKANTLRDGAWAIFLNASMRRFVKTFARRFLPGDMYFRVLGSPSGIESVDKLRSITVYRSAKIENCAPGTIHEKIHGRFLPERFFPEAFVVFLSDGMSTSDGYTLTGRGRLILQTSVEIHFNNKYPRWNSDAKQGDYVILKGGRRLPKVHSDRGSVGTLTSRWQSNYFHWLFDVLPRIHLIELAGFNAERLYVQAEKRFQRETLDLLGYKIEHVIDAGKYEVIRASELIVPSVPGIPGIVPTWACNFVRNKFLERQCNEEPEEEGNYRMIYVSRESARYRRIRNENEVISFLESSGFMVVKPEELSFAGQVRLFKDADTIVAGHGSGLANLVFCKRGAKVVEIFSPDYVNPCYWYLSQAVDVDYYYMLGEGGAGMAEGDRIWVGDNGKRDIDVDVGKLEKTLELVFKER